MNGDRIELRTSCRRQVTTARFRLPATPRIERVVLRVDPVDDHCETVWASLTADEALALGQALIAHAEAIRPR